VEKEECNAAQAGSESCSDFEFSPSAFVMQAIISAASSKQQAVAAPARLEIVTKLQYQYVMAFYLRFFISRCSAPCQLQHPEPWLTSHLSISSFKMVQCGGLGISKPSEHTSPSMFHSISISDSRALQNPESIHRSFRFRE
jgi:hypothetical protein